MSKQPDLSSLEAKLGYSFKNRAFLQQALTHSSKGGSANNERIEFLGDRVLNLVIAENLFRTLPEENEGGLAKRHSGLVQGRMLFFIGGILNIGDYVNMSESERQGGGAENENIISDATEATLGAIFLDGGLDGAREVILRLWGDNTQTLSDAHQDPKTELQEWVQARGLPLPEYEIVHRSGPDHAPLFEVEVRVKGYDSISSEGASRSKAEKSAAMRMLARLKNTP